MLPIEMKEAQRKRERESDGEEKGGPDKVELEALAGRLSRRGGSTPPEGDFGACLRELSGNGEGTVVREGGSRRCGRGGGG